MKCDSCIHKEVCKDKPPESYPQFMINIMTDKCEHYINNTDIQPVKHGRWIWDNSPEFGNPYGSYKCSECNERQSFKENYCPNCGAKMDGDDTYDKPT